MTGKFDINKYLSFFKKELNENLLSFWMPRCLDKENGGYLNCFTNDGSRLISKDKYIWSEGRFLWLFSKLAACDWYTEAEKEQFLEYARSGRDFLMKNALIADGDFRCVFLCEADGTPKYVDGYSELDMSISADCFVVLGFAAYITLTGDKECYDFAKKLCESVFERYESGNYRSLPYPLSATYRSHAKPMILTNVFCEMYRAALLFDNSYAQLLLKRIDACQQEVMEVFADANNLVHEFKYKDGDFPQDLFGQHINPGHTIEDMWFQIEAGDLMNTDRYIEKIVKITKKTFETGWDKDYGGLLHFVRTDGDGMHGDVGIAKDEPQMKLVLDDWASKLWWVHSEALYTSLLLYMRTGDEELLCWFYKTFEYTFKTFPNPDKTIGEWIQIRKQNGEPQDKVVALPVKDPYHIMRNFILTIELLEKEACNL